MKRRTFIGGMAATAALAASTTASFAADWPRRPINLVVPYKAGGGTDAYARAISAAMRWIFSGVMPQRSATASGAYCGSR